MPVVGLRQLSRETREVVEQLEADGEPVVVTRHGRPIAALTPLTDQQAAAVALAVVPELVASRERAAEAIAQGEGTPATELLAEFEIDDAVDESVGSAGRLEQIELPAEWLGRLAATSVPVGVGAVEPILALNVELLRTVVASSLRGALERVRIVNANIAAELGGGGAALSVEAYAEKLEQVTTAERLTVRPPSV